MIYFDNAATTHHKPECVINAVNEAMVKYSANPGRSGHILSTECSEMIYNAREKIAKYFNANSFENVVFTLNCTMSLNTVIKGLLNKGDHIIISDLEHNSVSRPVFDLNKNGIDFSIFKVEKEEDKTLENIKALIKSNTKAIACTHGSNVFGIKLPIERIGKLCKEKGILFILDAAQTAGVIEIDMKKQNIDYLCIAAHKGLYAPMGTGILITDDKPKPLILGGTGSHSVAQAQPSFLPDKFESGTINVPGIAGISKGIDFLNEKGTEIFEKEYRIIMYIYNCLKKDEKFILYNVPELPVLSFNIKNLKSETVSKYLNDNDICVRAGLHCSPLAHKKFNTIKTGTVRVSSSYFNEFSQADKLVDVLKNI